MKELLLNNPEIKTEIIEMIDWVTEHKIRITHENHPYWMGFGKDSDYDKGVKARPYLSLQYFLKNMVENNTITEEDLNPIRLYYKENFSKEEEDRRSEILKIKEVVERRGISNIVHFTQTKNLEGILNSGVLARDNLFRGIGDWVFNDNLRLDSKLNYSSFSIEFPNIEMLRALKYKEKDTKWVILVFDSQILYTCDCLFYPTNAASNEVRHKDVNDFKGATALERLFTWKQEERNYYLRKNNPTDVQAEVMIKDYVSIDYLKFCILNEEEDFLDFQREFPDLDIRHSPDRTGLFNTRNAYNCGY